MDDTQSDIKQNIYQLHERSQRTKSALETHEAVCAERYERIFEKLDALNEMVERNNEQINELYTLATQSKMSFKTIIFLGSLIGGLTAFAYTLMKLYNGN